MYFSQPIAGFPSRFNILVSSVSLNRQHSRTGSSTATAVVSGHADSIRWYWRVVAIEVSKLARVSYSIVFVVCTRALTCPPMVGELTG